MRPRKNDTAVNLEALLRSINIRMDATEADRIAHFRPTAKSVPFLEALIGRKQSRAWLVTAPYGTGKSLAATYILHLVENRKESKAALQGIERRMRHVSAPLADFAGRRRRKEAHGLVLALDGQEPDLPGAIQRGIVESMARLKLGRQARPIKDAECRSIRDALNLMNLAQEKAAAAGCDRCVILWDEFGRHLECLVDEGRASELSDVQTLAEYAARSQQLPTTLGLLSHQRLLQYADRASHSVRAEWAKVEGRFSEHHYVDDSRELFRLLADVIAARRPDGLKRPTKKAFKKAAEHAINFGWFPDWKPTELSDLLADAYPLEPAVLAALPSIAGRVAQNERTLFAFLYDQSLEEPVGIDHLYKYFSPAMRADTGVGGAHRRWLEAESALSKTDDDPLSVRALTAACLLGLGESGERKRTGLNALWLAVSGYGDEKAAQKAIDQLVDRKLLLHRKHTDQISLWHGTDLDLRSRLEEAKARERDAFDVVDFLNAEVPPPVWKPVAHNDRFDIRRYLQGHYCSIEELGAYLGIGQHVTPLNPGEDGRVIYVIAEDEEEITKASELLASELSHPRIVVAVPGRPIDLTEAALEVWCLRQLQHDPDLINEDPLAASELEQFADDARANLQRLTQRLAWPSGDEGPCWYHRGERLQMRSAQGLREFLSSLMDEVFPLAPILRNEMINRHQPSRVLVNARKKAELGILERAGSPDLGLSGHTPDASIFRTLMSSTGLYGEDAEGRYRFSQPEELEDAGFQAAWARVKAFFTEPSNRPKEPRQLIEELMEPPFGIRRGVMPILFAAGYKAFPSAVSIMQEGRYLEDILASEVEDIIRNSDKYRVNVIGLTAENRQYLQSIYSLFLSEEETVSEENDLIRACYDAIAAWQEQLPPAALTSSRLGPNGRALQQTLVKYSDPTELLFDLFPRVAGEKKANNQVVEAIGAAKSELEAVADDYADQAANALRRILAIKEPNGAGALKVAQDWAACFPEKLLDRLPDTRLKGLVTRLKTPYQRDRQLVDSLGFLLIGRPVHRWDDASLTVFERDLDAAARRVEEVALQSKMSIEDLGEGSTQLAQLAEERMRQWFSRYEELVGQDAARETLSSLSGH
jgi:hypothetical protein